MVVELGEGVGGTGPVDEVVASGPFEPYLVWQLGQFRDVGEQERIDIGSLCYPFRGETAEYDVAAGLAVEQFEDAGTAATRVVGST